MGEPKRASAAEQKSVIVEDDPVWQAVLNAPLDDEPETEEERAGVEAAKTEVAAGGRTYSHAEVEAMIAERREREG